MIKTTDGAFTQHTLDNGLKVVIEAMPDVRSIAAGFLVETGARDEIPELAGVSHFLEHMMFKGTAKRTWREITIDFDRMGSTYNAYTSEDRTVYYGWVRTGDIETQIELLADMLRSTLPEDEFQTERKVVLEEIAMGKDNLEHVAFDFLQEKVFAGHPLAWPILGYDKTVRDLKRDDMWAYFQRRYAPRNVTLVVAGCVDPQHAIAMAERFCGSWPDRPDDAVRHKPRIHGGVDVHTLDRFTQQVIALSFPACGTADPQAETASAIATVLGGDNSRFYWNIIQEGVSHRAGVYHMDYSDCGIMLLYGSCQPESVEKLLDAIRKEANRIHTDGVQAHELDRVKNKRRTGLAVEAEAPYHRLTQLMDDMQYHGHPRSVDQRLAEVDAVTPDSVKTYLEEFPINIEGHLTSVGPRNWPVEA